MSASPPDVIVPIISRRGRTRFWLLLATTWLAPLAMWAQAHFFDPHADYADQGITGPFRVRAIGTRLDGRTAYEALDLLPMVAPGETFGWVSWVCLEKGTYMLARPDLVRLRDGAVVASGRQVLWTPEDHRCGAATAGLAVPADAEDGDYELRRMATVRPLSWLPLHAPLARLGVKVGAEPKP